MSVDGAAMTNVVKFEGRGSQPGTFQTSGGGTKPPRSKTNTRSSGGGGGSSIADIAALRTDVDWLKRWFERLAIASGVVALALAGVGWAVYNGAKDQMQALAVGQQSIAGKIDTFDAKVSGKFELLEQRFDNHSERTLQERDLQSFIAERKTGQAAR